VRRGLARLLPGSRLDAVELRRGDLRWPIPIAAVRALRGRRLIGVGRRSKYLLLRFDGPRAPVAIVHLGMSGRLFVSEAHPPPPFERHEHWRIAFGARCLRYVDARRFGSLDVVAQRELGGHRLLSALGPEPLEAGFDGARLFARSRGRKVATKTFLMDARNVVGVGNIYACEACHRAGVRPRRAIGALSRAQCERLAAAVRGVLREAIAQGGTTLRDYVGAERETGYFQRSLRVYGRGGEPCRACGAAIKRVVSSGRATYYCARCQE
jgi:formamidopyrimidine-DNA glycosylase